MRILGELPKKGLKVSVFKTDSRLLVKFEDLFLEQTYKFRETENLANLNDVNALLTDEFMEQVYTIFGQMRQAHAKGLLNRIDLEEEDFPEII